LYALADKEIFLFAFKNVKSVFNFEKYRKNIKNHNLKTKNPFLSFIFFCTIKIRKNPRTAMAFSLIFNGKALFFIKKTLTETFHQSISISLTVIYLQAYRQLFLATLHNYTKKETV
jgi:hypothetical protein